MDKLLLRFKRPFAEINRLAEIIKENLIAGDAVVPCDIIAAAGSIEFIVSAVHAQTRGSSSFGIIHRIYGIGKHS